MALISLGIKKIKKYLTYNLIYISELPIILNIYNENKNHIIASFSFPRQGKTPHRCIADYFKNDDFDIVGFSFVSLGHNIAQFEKKIYDQGNFSKYYLIHGLASQLTEALADITHKQMRLDLNITTNEQPTLNDVKISGYQGCRYSPGYASCPDLSLNKTIFKLLKPEDFGIKLSETFQIHPEQSTCAIIVPNSKAKYFNI